MSAAIPVSLLLILPITLFLANSFICAGELADQDGTVLEDFAALASYSACEGTPAWLGWTLGILTYVPMAIVLFVLFAPIIGGLLANPVAGTIFAVATLTTALTVFLVFGGLD